MEKTIQELETKEKKLKEKLKQIEAKKKELIQKAREERIISDTYLRFYPALHYWVILLNLLIEKAGIKGKAYSHTPKALAMALLIYKCNKGRAVGNERSCFKRIVQELREVERNLSIKLPALSYLEELLKRPIDFQQLQKKLKGKSGKEKVKLVFKLAEEELKQS